MPYAVEAKKRKFDRILESLTDGAVSPSRASLDGGAASPDAASDSSKRRRVSPSGPAGAGASPGTSTASLSGHYLPSSRAAFLQRLETFRRVTQWHVPSTDPIHAAAWAKRGWVCVDTDTVACGACRERVHVSLELDAGIVHGTDQAAMADEDRFVLAAEIYDTVVRRYQDLIVTGHTDACLWRARGCDPSIQRIEGLLNTHSAVAGLRSRYDGLAAHPDEIPAVVPLPVASSGPPADAEPYRFRDGTAAEPHALRLAVCGWRRKGDDVIECEHCFRSLGLWLYRGPSPAMDKLDAVADHLEYCPWRSPDAQATAGVGAPRAATTTPSTSTSISTPPPRSGPAPPAAFVAGWELVWQAMARESPRRSGTRDVGSETAPEGPPAAEPLTPEQRAKRMRDLLLRIKEIKKPFNVKGLLRRKTHSRAQK